MQNTAVYAPITFEEIVMVMISSIISKYIVSVKVSFSKLSFS